MDERMLTHYAELLIKTGVNLQQDQILVINSPVECAYFARLVGEKAFEAGALNVMIHWDDEKFSKIKYKMGRDEIFSQYPSWDKDFYMINALNNAAFLSISASDPELMQDVSVDRLIAYRKAGNEALKDYRDRLFTNRNVWCVASVPTPGWARKVFPGIPEEEAVEKLWQAIFEAVRADLEDPVAAWTKHVADLKKRMDTLNGYRFQSLKYQNSIGTNLTIELPEDHIWLGGSDFTQEGIEFVANMPTEEIFTAPNRTGVNGRVVSSKPLNYNGNLIENFSMTFKDGKVVDYTAEKGYEILKGIIKGDEGSCYLGEVALVPVASPISAMGILFYNTLFDENASCHLALGGAYPVNLKGGEGMTKEELLAHGLNHSAIHVDFMIGTEDLSIIGVTRDQKEVPIFIQGNFKQM